MITLDNVTLGQGGFALSADVTFRRGVCTAIMGPSGGGKSTLLHGLAGFLPARTGRITVAGLDVTDQPPAVRPVSLLFQDNNLFPHMTIAQNVGLGLRPDLKLTDDQHVRVEAMLADMGLEGMGARRPAAMSGGQASRAALARALLRDKPVLLLDEPFAALGPAMRADMMALLRRVMADKALTVLIVSHQPEDAARIADDIAVVAEGRVAPPQDRETLLANPPGALRDYLG
ncbi:thiamine transport system ATP-binding protein [Rubricella aquisinus]|uniref:Thiamine transport system ATP-binding protein n=1 Tax=Rubricella aquisinus TaxID=2028108 RepID=A0A840X4N1_9RHOB|nr:ATP-binding cassette domain-containing protein [Rubricella aquisinus]MBB5516795.1 thiamine transport system ATP-binding protein [Rubricella aquisinus]